jgi:hypothetical protein
MPGLRGQSAGGGMPPPDPWASGDQQLLASAAIRAPSRWAGVAIGLARVAADRSHCDWLPGMPAITAWAAGTAAADWA